MANRLLLLQLSVGFCGFLVGIVGFVVCTFAWESFVSGLLSLYSAILFGFLFHLHRLRYKDVLQDWYSSTMYDGFKLFSFTGFLIGCAFISWEIFDIAYYKKEAHPEKLVCASLTLISGGALYLAAKKYCRLTEEHESLLPPSRFQRRY